MDIATYILLAPVLSPVVQEAMANEVVDSCAQDALEEGVRLGQTRASGKVGDRDRCLFGGMTTRLAADNLVGVGSDYPPKGQPTDRFQAV